MCPHQSPIAQSPLESWGGLPPVLCQGRRMDVRRGVLRCSSRKLRSSSFVELVAVDRDTEIKRKWSRHIGALTIKSKTEKHTQVKFCGTSGISERGWVRKVASQCALTFAVCSRHCVQVPVYCRRKNNSIPKSRQKYSFFLWFELTATHNIVVRGLSPHTPLLGCREGRLPSSYIKIQRELTAGERQKCSTLGRHFYIA